MKKEIQNLENKINDLVMRIKNAEENLTNNVTTEINSVRDELQQLINEFDLLKSQMQEENSDATITEDDIESIISLINNFITNCATQQFSSYSFDGNNIDDVELSISYNLEVQLDSATIDVEDYFSTNFSFEYDDFINYIDNAGLDEYGILRGFVTRDLFQLIAEIINKSVNNIDTSIRVREFDNFECEMDGYKTIEVTEITIDSSELCEQFVNEFDYDNTDIEDIIKNFHNFKSEEISQKSNSEE